MAGELLGTAISGLLVSQRGIATTSHNISNVNTEGYTRQSVELKTRQPQVASGGFIGSGVNVESIRRIYDQFQVDQIRVSSSSHSQFNEFSELAFQVDNLLADEGSGLTPALQGFFDAIQGVSNDPSSIPARQVMLSEAEIMTDRFQSIDQRLIDLNTAVNTGLNTLVTEINSLATSIADANRNIADVFQLDGGEANDLLDQRDKLINQLSEKVAVSIVEQDNGAVNVFIGNGQTLVTNFATQSLQLVNNSFDPEKTEVGFATSSGVVNITDLLNGGEIGGLLDFRNQMLEPTRNALGHLAIGVSSVINAQHRLGVDLNGNLGGDLFEPINTTSPKVFGHTNNTGVSASQITVVATDPNLMQTSDYELERRGSTYTLTRLSDSTVFTLTTFPGGSETIDGMTLSLASGTIADGDRHLIRAVRQGARDIALANISTQEIAAAVPVRASTSLANTGTGSIHDTTVTNATTYVPDTYSVILADDSGAIADGGATRGVFTDNNADSTLQYELRINGSLVYTQNEAAAPLADLNALAAAINGVGDANVANTGVKAYVDSNSILYLANVPATSLPITVTETLNTTAGTVEDGDTITGYFGTALTGATNATGTQTFTNTADSYIVVDSAGNTETSGAYSVGVQINFNGIQASLEGQPNLGDSFTISQNSNGVGDNRNALSMIGLQSGLTMRNGSTDFNGMYSQLVSSVGTKTRQADLSREAQSGFLSQAIAAREAVSGVNLDEEAANLIRYQQAYQASARVISIIDTVFQTLVNVIGR